MPASTKEPGLSPQQRADPGLSSSSLPPLAPGRAPRACNPCHLFWRRWGTQPRPEHQCGGGRAGGRPRGPHPAADRRGACLPMVCGPQGPAPCSHLLLTHPTLPTMGGRHHPAITGLAQGRPRAARPVRTRPRRRGPCWLPRTAPWLRAGSRNTAPLCAGGQMCGAGTGPHKEAQCSHSGGLWVPCPVTPPLPMLSHGAALGKVAPGGSRPEVLTQLWPVVKVLGGPSVRDTPNPAPGGRSWREAQAQRWGGGWGPGLAGSGRGQKVHQGAQGNDRDPEIGRRPSAGEGSFQGWVATQAWKDSSHTSP